MIGILHIIDTTGSGGAETVFSNLVNNLDKSKFRSEIILLGKGWLYSKLVTMGFSPIVIESKGSFDFSLLISMYKLIKSKNIKIIHAHLFGSLVYSSLLGMLTRVKVIGTLHGSNDIPKENFVYKLKNIILRLGLDKLIFVSDSLRKELSCKLSIGSKQKTQVIYNGVSFDDSSISNKQSFLQDKFGIESGQIVIGALGNVRLAKGYDFFIDCVAELKKRGNNIRAFVAGDKNNKLFNKLNNKIKDNNLEADITFIGFVDNVSAYLKSLDIFALTSRTEGFSIATIEAMSVAAPIVVTKSGGPEEFVVNEENGILISVDNVEEFVNAVERLCNDKELSKKLGRNAASSVKKTFSLEKMVSEYSSTYLKILT